jgi:hypothetical protein
VGWVLFISNPKLNFLLFVVRSFLYQNPKLNFLLFIVINFVLKTWERGIMGIAFERV